MSRYFIKVNSVTHAIKAKNVLNSNGIRAQVVRKGTADKREGCGYVVTVDGDINNATDILRRNHVKTLGYGVSDGRV